MRKQISTPDRMGGT